MLFRSTVLVRHLANDTAPTKSAGALPRLYAVNTIGAAVGALLTDYALIPALGLRTTALVAVALNALAARLDTRVKPPRGDRPGPVVFAVFNPHPHEYRGPLEVEAAMDYRPI